MTSNPAIFYFVSSEGALIAITPYDYTHPLFEHTPVLDNNLNKINAMMTLVAMITIKTEITKTTSAHEQHQLISSISSISASAH